MKPRKRATVFVPLLLPPKDKILQVLKPVAEVKLGHGRKFTEDELIEEIVDVDGILVSMQEHITRRVIESGTKLKIISKYGTGVDNIDVKAATEKGVIVANSALNAIPVAEHVLLLILSCLRKLPQLFEHLRSGGWGLTIPRELLGRELFQSTVGIIGLGKIGFQVANRVKCLGAKVLVYDPYINQEQVKFVRHVDFETLLRESDIVTLHVPLTAETRSMIGEKELRAMKSSAILVNTSRGAVVDEDALVTALEKGWIAGAGLDVLETFPPPRNSPLLKLQNLVLTPHMGGSTTNARTRVVKQAADNIVQVLRGKLPPLEFIVNKELVKN